MNDELHDARRLAADEAFALYNFGDETVKDTGGWEFDNQTPEWVRTVFLEADGPSIRRRFVVRFQPGTAEVAEVYVAG